MPKNFIERPRKNEKDDAIQYVKSLLTQAREDNRNEDIEKLEELVRLLHTKKYGLVWEEHAEIVEEEMKTKIPVFVEDAGRKIVGNPDSEDYNFLLEGDNLHSLHLLEKTHSGKIDVIYIDPPYNTGNKDFIYNDKIVDKTDGYSHSKWLSFMSKRLEIARNLLSDKGVIFISIDDNEFSQLKLLCDDIFGEHNKLITLHTQVRYSDKTLNEKNDWQPVLEYVLVYSRDKTKFKANKPEEEYSIDKFIFEFQEISEGTEFFVNGRKVTVFKKGEWKSIKHRTPAENLLKETWVSGSIYSGTGNGTMVQNVIEPRIHLDGVGSLYKIDGLGEDGLGYRYFVGPSKEGATRSKMYSGIPISRNEELSKGTAKKYKSIPNYFDFSADFGNIRHEGKVAFNSGKKPIKMLKQLINYHTFKNGIVLDFFAGSGSTGHAVAQLNKEDGGNRKYILCTNNENKIAEEVTYKRLSNIQYDLPHNLKYFKTDFVDKAEFPDFTLETELLKYITPLVEIEFGIDISNPSVQIILTEEHLEALLQNHELQAGATLFIHPDVFLETKEQEQLSELQITLQEIPDYFFGKELWS
ncbi:site-specific DNA-methyltransferase [Streptococcus uberis]|uniref:site-specific DNA-methyltransferase n=1 Tax=Streptococcus uberis TaxID=1349 RepID=UPI003D6B9004